MTQTIRVPDPVKDRVKAEAEQNDISHGAVVREWMEKATKFDEMEVRRSR